MEPLFKRTLGFSSSLLSESALSELQYHKVADQALDALTEHYEVFCDSRTTGEVTLSQGVLTIDLGEQGTYVINKQAPNKQIWLSSPRTGPRRFEYNASTDEWICNREGVSLTALLTKEIDQA